MRLRSKLKLAMKPLSIYLHMTYGTEQMTDCLLGCLHHMNLRFSAPDSE